MEHVASQVVHDLFLGSEMRPRRWYSDEIGPPPRRNVTLDRRTWRYRALIRHKNEDAAPTIGAASKFFGWRNLILPSAAPHQAREPRCFPSYGAPIFALRAKNWST